MAISQKLFENTEQIMESQVTKIHKYLQWKKTKLTDYFIAKFVQVSKKDTAVHRFIKSFA